MKKLHGNPTGATAICKVLIEYQRSASGGSSDYDSPIHRNSVMPELVNKEPHFEHERALVESPHIGKGTRIWAFAHILAGAKIGADCNICDHTFVENDVVIGD